MTHANRFALLSSAVVATGAAAAAGAFLLAARPASVGPLPQAALILPADARFVLGLDVRRFAATEFHKRYSAAGSSSRPEVFRRLEERTGLVAERDIEQFVAAGMGPGRGLALLIGRFDRARLARTLDTGGPGTTRRTVGRATLYSFGSGDAAGRSLAILDDRTLLMGSEPDLASTLQSAAAGATPLRSNPLLLARIERVRPGATFWMVGDGGMLDSMPTGGLGGLAMALPGLKGVILSADLTPDVDLSILGETTSEREAQNLAATVRGLVGLLALQGAQKPELAGLADAIRVTPQGSDTVIEARLPYDMLDALWRKRSPAAPLPK